MVQKRQKCYLSIIKLINIICYITKRANMHYLNWLNIRGYDIHICTLAQK